MKVYIVRHGQTDSNLAKVYNFQGEDINKNGIEQAKILSEKIKDLKYDVVYCSPFLRARHTAEIINRNNIQTIYDERIQERNPGNLEGKPWGTTDRNEYWNYYSKNKFGTEESVEHLFERVYSFLEDLKNKDYESVLVVAHSGVSKAFYGYFNGIPEDGNFLELGLKNGEIAEYKF